MTSTSVALDRALTGVELDLKAAVFYNRRGRQALALFAELADVYKSLDQDWLASDSHEARLTRRIEALRDADEPDVKLLDARAAAELLGLTKPDGTPRDTFYSRVAPAIGYRVGKTWRFPADKVAAYRKGEIE
jgi:hypothetical protein